MHLSYHILYYLVAGLISKVLRLNEHNVVEASSGREAIDIIASSVLPDLIFMDYRMPVHNGIDCAKRLKAVYPALKIIMISGYFGVDDDGYLIANKHLFTDVILKPFRIKDVVRAVEYALGAKSRAGETFLESIDTVHQI